MEDTKRSEGVPWARLGILFGLLGAASMLLFGPIGVSGTYPRLTGAALSSVAPEWAGEAPYLAKMGGLLRPETMIAVGLVLGGLLAARLGRRNGAAACEVRSSSPRLLQAFIGGFLLLLGARLAGGCTSGHVISGIAQLSVSGLVFGAGVFASGIFTAKLLKRRAR